MENKLFELIENETYSNADLKACISDMNPADIAEVLEETSHRTLTLRIFKLLSKDIAADVFTYLPSAAQEDLLNTMSDREVSNIVAELFIDDAVDVLEEMPANVVKKVLKNADEATRKVLNDFLNYPEDSAGSLMTPEFVDLKKEMTVADAFTRIKKTGVDKETIYTCYVISPDRKLEGIVTVRSLLLAAPGDMIGDIMETDPIYCNTLEKSEIAAGIVKKYNLSALPVVDTEGRLVGIITVDDVLEAIVEAHTEDIEIMAGMSPSEKPYLETSVGQMWSKRIVWLIVLLISGFLSGFVISGYEDVLSACMVLSISIPMLMGTGGNGGAQASTLIIRSLALGDIKPGDWLKVLLKELLIAALIGIILSPICFGKVMLIDGGNALEALTVSITLILTVIIAKTIGAMLPIIAIKIKIDPAVMAAPLITTIVDLSSLLIYFSLAIMILGI